MKQKYTFSTDSGEVTVSIMDGAIFLNDGVSRDILGKPMKTFSQHGINRIRLGNLDDRDMQQINAAVQKTLKKIVNRNFSKARIAKMVQNSGR